jgi:hypothetical protein
MDEPVLPDHHLLDELAVPQLDVTRSVKRGGNLTAKNKSEALNAIKVSVLNCHDTCVMHIGAGGVVVVVAVVVSIVVQIVVVVVTVALAVVLGRDWGVEARQNVQSTDGLGGVILTQPEGSSTAQSSHLHLQRSPQESCI